MVIDGPALVLPHRGSPRCIEDGRSALCAIRAEQCTASLGGCRPGGHGRSAALSSGWLTLDVIVSYTSRARSPGRLPSSLATPFVAGAYESSTLASRDDRSVASHSSLGITN
jgi:hypothetical protein